jgi:hypothetical protein
MIYWIIYNEIWINGMEVNNKKTSPQKTEERERILK